MRTARTWPSEGTSVGWAGRRSTASRSTREPGLPVTTTTLPDETALYSPTPVDGWGILKDAQTANRANLTSVDLSTGNLRSFMADTNGSVNALASDGAALYLGGTFTTVNGVPRGRVAKV